ncbi:MAG: hypothetical protein IH823_07845 [Candidatus Dadabacteria bacterium]|nr:hypothetical protein [Candidatus Dadabacteria bacterium]
MNFILNKKRRGKTIEEFYGRRKAKKIHRKMSLAQIGNCKGKGKGARKI